MHKENLRSVIIRSEGVNYVIFPKVELTRKVFDTLLELHLHWITYTDSNAEMVIKDYE